jgi:16S rRNA (cytosine967-C5)-methyltransferase
MTPAARLQAAIDIFDEVERSRAPADRIIEHWGRKHRFAGSKDRAAIAERVFQILRRRSECAWAMQNSTPRDWVLGALKALDAAPADDIESLFTGEGYGPPPLSEDERKRLRAPVPPMSPEIVASYPAWVAPELERAFGARMAEEMAGFLERAPVDIRANTLKTGRTSLENALAKEGIETEPRALTPWALRIAAGASPRQLTRTAAFDRGLFEIQDAGSQAAARMTGAAPGETVVDLCAGAGGKTLALAAMMENKGRILACDVHAPRLGELKARAARAGAQNIETLELPPEWPGVESALDAFTGKAHRVLIDAPCSGSGTWRRNPETKWRLKPEDLDAFARMQACLLAAAAPLSRKGGTLTYVTCSLFPKENEDVIAAFLATHPHLRKAAERRFSPNTTGTDGFYVCTLEAAP